MKFLKILLIVLGIIVLVGAIAALAMPKDYNVERSIEVEATLDQVKKASFGLEAMQLWSPWAKLDTAMEITFEGEEATVGQKYHWKGNEDVGEGIQEIIKIEGNRQETQLTFISPMETQSVAYIELEELENGKVKIRWGLDGHMDFPMNLMIPTMDGYLGADLEKGLKNMKEVCENMEEEPEATTYAIQEIDFTERNYVAFRQMVKFEEMQTFYATHFTAASAYAKQNGLEFDGMPSGIYYMWDMENMQADMAAGIALKGEFTEVPEGYEKITLSGKALVIDYYGSYEGVGAAHEAMDVYMKENGLEQNEVVMEEYITDPTTVSDPSEILTKVYYFVK